MCGILLSRLKMNKKFVDDVIKKLKEDLNGFGESFLTTNLSDKALRRAYGLAYKDIKSDIPSREKIMNKSLIEAYDQGLIDINYVPKGGKLNDWVIVQLNKKDFNEIKNYYRNKADREQ